MATLEERLQQEKERRNRVAEMIAREGPRGSGRGGPGFPEDGPGFGEAFGRGALDSFVGNILGIPDFLATMGQRTAQAPSIADIASTAVRGAPEPRAEGENALPQFGDRRLQEAGVVPETNEVFAGAQRLGEMAGKVRTGVPKFAEGLVEETRRAFGQETQGPVDTSTQPLTPFNEAVQQQEDTSARFAEQQPAATGAGRMLGTGATLAGLRVPFRPSSFRTATKTKAADEAVDVADRIAEGIKEFSSNLGRGSVKAAEAALEGATVAALEGGDIKETAALSAGGQAAGSVGLFLSEKPIKRLAPAWAAIWVGSNMYRAAAPGLEQNVFESSDFATEKVLTTLGLGALGAFAGAGRLRGRLAEKMPEFADAVTAIPRGSAQSLLTEMTKEDNQDLRQTMTAMAQNPNKFSNREIERIGNLARKGDMEALNKEVNKLMRSKSFREKVRGTDNSDEE